jgi:hypothetical protein
MLDGLGDGGGLGLTWLTRGGKIAACMKTANMTFWTPWTELLTL